ncbi:hypothetical protein [Arthrobacter sunyaminii]|uniref:hypothetical protein n=1 Tax=Arthrobacter sunyaminii TaxID=2816859 RepID=UPI001A9446E6|nr:hypothetical protein [Arthrobacter sunyaminii]MBO0897155.1 hypothetical protein [Arthrobacter sunyaminii]
MAGESLKPWIRTDLFDEAAPVKHPVPGRLLGWPMAPNGMLCPAGRSLMPRLMSFNPVPLNPGSFSPVPRIVELFRA